MAGLAILAAAFLLAASGIGPALAECRDDPTVVGKCVTLHGRIRLDANLRRILLRLSR